MPVQCLGTERTKLSLHKKAVTFELVNLRRKDELSLGLNLGVYLHGLDMEALGNK